MRSNIIALGKDGKLGPKSVLSPQLSSVAGEESHLPSEKKIFSDLSVLISASAETDRFSYQIIIIPSYIYLSLSEFMQYVEKTAKII